MRSGGVAPPPGMLGLLGAATDVWGCNYDKSVVYCTKVGGKHCTTHCERRLQDKRRDKVCK